MSARRFRKTRRAVHDERAADFVCRGGGRRRLDAPKNGECLFIACSGNQVARGLGNREECDAEEERRYDFDDEHRAPRFDPSPQGCIDAPCRAREKLVREQRCEDSDDDPELLKGRQASTEIRRRNLGDVRGAHHARRPHGGPAHESCDGELVRGPGKPRPDRRDRKDDRRDQHRRATPEAVSQAACPQGAERAAEQNRCDGEPGSRARRPKGALNAADSAVDHSAVEAEENTSQSGRARQKRDVGEATCARHAYALARGMAIGRQGFRI